MTDRTHIPFDPNLAPGTWCLVIDSQGKPRQPVHRCPKCETASALKNHSVSESGEVNASIACFSPCDYHIMGVLDDWTHGNKAAGKEIGE